MNRQLTAIGAALAILAGSAALTAQAAQGSAQGSGRGSAQETPQGARGGGQAGAAIRHDHAAARDTEVEVIGCVELEADYRKRMAAGRGGALGTGVGAANEFVLTNIRPANAEQGREGRGRGNTPTGTAGAGGGVYTLTGDQEKNLTRDIGRQVAVVGVVENAGKPSTGADLKDISDLPRIQITTWHPVGDFCPA
jgi:hypothetical protein